jgi:BolA protein
MKTSDRIRAKLVSALTPARLEIHDDSRLHEGHAGAGPGGESHFRLEIVSRSFAGLSRVVRQRLVYDLLAEELRGNVHALQLATLTPEEDAAAAKKGQGE